MGMRRPYRFLIGVCLLLTPFAQAASPKFKTPGTIKLEASATVNFVQNLRDLLVNPTMPGLTWEITNQPGWMQLDLVNERLIGTPGCTDIKVANFLMCVRNGEGADCDHPSQVTVRSVPAWTANPVDVGKINEDSTLNFNLNSKLSLTCPEAVVFSSTGTKPGWMSVVGSGIVSGTPHRADVGTFSGFNFVATTSSGGVATVPGQGEVLKVIHGPKWIANPNTLPNANEDFLYQQSVASLALNNEPTGSALSFSIVTGTLTGWLSVTPGGNLSGTPGKFDVGAVSITLRVSQVVDGITVSDDAVFHFSVIHTNHVPKWSQNPLAFSVDEEAAASINLANSAADPDTGDTLTFSKVSGPTWGSINSAGILSGTPQMSDEGLNVFIARVSDNSGLSADVTVNVTVNHVNHAPLWTQNPVTLPDAPERSFYSQSVASFATDVDPGEVLTYSKVSGPAWASISASGLVSGTPQRTDVGLNNLVVRVTDKAGSTADVTAKITVLKVPLPPRWLQNPVLLGTANEDFAFSFNLAPLAVDDNGNALTFTKKSGPAWLQVASNGSVSGTPGKNDVGPFTAVLTVASNEGSSDAGANGTVVHTNHAPIWSQNPIAFSINEETPLSKNLAPFASDPDAGDTISFSKVSGPAWGGVNAAGLMTGTPQMADEGTNTFVVRVTDNSGLGANVTVVVTVLHVNHAPVWSQNPISLPDAPERSFYTQGLLSFATDVDPGDTKTFSKVSGPAWAAVNPGGTLSGTPKRADVGTNVFVVRVTDAAGASADVTVNINVLKVFLPPRWLQNPIVLSLAKEDFAYAFDLKPLAVDDNGNALTFSKSSGPVWLLVASDGTITGTPGKGDLGPYTAVFTVMSVEGSADANASGTVQHTNHVPVWSQDPIVFSVDEEKPVSKDLAPFASDPDAGDTIGFSKVSGPIWGGVNSAGLFTGTPQMSNEGLNTFVVRVTDNGGLSKDVTVNVTVNHVNHAPAWSQNPLNLPDAPERSPYSQSLVTFVTDVDAGDLLTFSKVSGPAWASISGVGVISGTPQRADVGSNSFIVRVTDKAGASADVTVKIAVIKVPLPPRWLQNPILLGNAQEDVAFTFNLAPLAVDDNGNALTFSKKSGPAWLLVVSNGSVSGTPGKNDVGVFTAVFTVTSNEGSTDADGNGTVVHTNHAPIWSQNPIAFSTNEESPLSKDLAPLASDPDAGDTISFSMISGPAWGSVSAAGVMTGTPQMSDEGLNAFIVRVTDNGGLSTDVAVNVTVLHVNHAPVWTQNPISLPDAPERSFYTQGLASFATDVDPSDTKTFSKVSGPAWVSVSSVGNISGTPKRADVGSNVFVVRVTDAAGAAADVTVNIMVLKVLLPPRWLQNPIALTPANEDVVYVFDLAPLAVDDNGNPLTFSKRSGPAWLQVTANGAISGTPGKADLGDFTAVVTVTSVEGSADANANGTVLHTNHKPVWAHDPIILSVNEDTPQNINLAPEASDSDGDTLTFSKISGPSWATVNGAGVLTGTPHIPDEGVNIFLVKADDGHGAAANVTVQITVNHINHSPFWTENPITLPNAPERIPYTKSLVTFAKDIDPGDSLSFSRVSGPLWASVSSDGTFAGIPTRSDVGPNTFVVRVVDRLGASADVTVLVTVDYVYQPPYWTKNPLTLDDAFEDQAYHYDISPFVVADGRAMPLVFSKKSGPGWLFVAADGKLSGTPRKGDVGLYAAVFSVTDGVASADVEANGRVIHTNHPPQWFQNPIVLSIDEEKPVSQNLATYATDPDVGDALTFTQISGPSWGSVSAVGLMTGTPHVSDEGLNVFVVRVQDNAGATADVNVNVTVQHVGPVWTQNPVVLPEAPERAFYTKSLSGFVFSVNPNDVLTFTKLGGPSWASISATGEFSGTPQRADLGVNHFSVRVTDVMGATADTVVSVTVIKIPLPPRWLEDPLPLGDAHEDVAFAFDLSTRAIDDNGNAITFSKKSGPAWMAVAANGAISGTPGKGDVGPFTAVLTVTSVEGFADTHGVGQVIHTNHTPAWDTNPIAFSVNEDAVVSNNLAVHASDSDLGDTLAFSLVSGPAWASVNASGVFEGTPRTADLGVNTFSVRVTDNHGASSDVAVLVTVRPVNHPPVWAHNPIAFSVDEDSAVSHDLAPEASDPDAGDVLSFSRISGPSWGSLSSAGVMTGTPHQADLGLNVFVVRVEDGNGGTADVTLNVTVLHVNHAPFWTQNPVVLPHAPERVPYAQSVTAFAKDIDPGDAIHFSKESGPAWASVASDGQVVGIPGRVDVGLNVFVIRATDLQGAFADVAVNISVDYVNQPPYWTQNPIQLTDAFEDKNYDGDIGPFAKDDDLTDVLRITLKSGPAWLKVSGDGKLSGTPGKGDIGNYDAIFTVTDGIASAEVLAIGRVIHTNHPPQWTENPIAFSTPEESPVSKDLVPFVWDPDSGDTHSYSKVSGPDWASVNAAGVMTGTPQIADEGPNTFVVRVTDNQGASADVTVVVTVTPVNHAPYWTQNPILLPDAPAKTAYHDSVATFAKDNDPGDTLTITKRSGPAWLSVSAAGEVTGTPSNSDVGLNAFVVRVTDRGGLFSDATININVLKTYTPPRWVQDPLRLADAYETKAYQYDVSPFAVSDDGLPLSFSMVSGPAWLSMNANGKLSGTPPAPDESYTAILSVTDGQTAVKVTALGRVLAIEHPPVWVNDPVILPNGTEKVAYLQDLTNYASSPDGMVLSFQKLSGPSWATVTMVGKFIGTPQHANIGLNTFKVRVIDTNGLFADVTVLLTVDPLNSAPVWTKDPIALGDIPINHLFTFDLSPFAIDSDGDPLTFSRVDGPGWLFVDSKGLLGGTPAEADLGAFVGTVSVSDGTHFANVGIFGKVTTGDIPPILHPEALMFSVKEGKTLDVNLNQTKYVTNPSGRPLTFELTPSDDWVHFNADGTFSAKPLHAHLGSHSYALKVSDDKGLSATGPMSILVLPDAQAPIWLENPIRYEATAGTNFLANISDKVKDPLGLPLVITKRAGPAWLLVSPNGALSGVPALADLGENNFTLTASNENLGSDVTVIITVKPPTEVIDTIVVDSAVPGAPAENLWVVDNAWAFAHYDELAQSLRNNIGVYYDALKTAGINHSGIFLSSNAEKWDGKPVPGKNGALLLSSTNASWVTDFRYRVDSIREKECRNSPIWSMFRFYQRVPDITELYHKTYMMPNVSMDVMVVTQQTDYFKYLAKGTPQASWDPEKYADEFAKTHQREKKSYRISVIAPECTELGNPYPPSDNGVDPVADQNPYRPLVKRTQGKYYSFNCQINMVSYLKDYAKDVIFRAYVNAKNRIHLSKKPIGPQTIRVLLGGLTLPGNTGSTDDKWFYDAVTNEVVIQWHLIDMATVKPGDKIEIHYQI